LPARAALGRAVVAGFHRAGRVASVACGRVAVVASLGLGDDAIAAARAPDAEGVGRSAGDAREKATQGGDAFVAGAALPRVRARSHAETQRREVRQVQTEPMLEGPDVLRVDVLEGPEARAARVTVSVGATALFLGAVPVREIDANPAEVPVGREIEEG